MGVDEAERQRLLAQTALHRAEASTLLDRLGVTALDGRVGRLAAHLADPDTFVLCGTLFQAWGLTSDWAQARRVCSPTVFGAPAG